MFNPKRIVKFWGRVLRWLLPLYAGYLLLFVLALYAHSETVTARRLALSLVAASVPVGVAVCGAFALAVKFMQQLYALKTGRDVFWYLVHRMFGHASFKPWMIMEAGKIIPPAAGMDSMLVQFGGSGNLVIRKDTAVVLERDGRLTRVEGPGLPHLEPFERVYDAVDLRPTRCLHKVEALSKEGIQVTCQADVEFQIQSGAQQATEETPYPMDGKAVFRAVTGKWIREPDRPADQRVLDWKGRIIGLTEGTLRFILARYPLDRLIAPERDGQEHPRAAIRRQLEAELDLATAAVGARMLKVELGQIKVADAITQQWIEGWRANWDRWGDEHLALAEAEYVDRVGSAQTEIVARRIRDMANVLHGLAQQDRKVFIAGALSQLYLGMRNLAPDSLAMTYMPSEATKMLQESARLSLASGDKAPESAPQPGPAGPPPG